ncbi:MAG: hypothetical protein WCZ66_03715 [Sphingomonadaceae bacterium]
MVKLPVLTGSLMAVALLGGCALNDYGGGWQYGDRVYASRQECLDAKKRAKTQGTVVGALGGAAAGAVLGGDLGETALAAGAGALAGNVLSGRNRNC